MMRKLYLLCVMLITMCLTFGCGSDESANEKTEKSDKVENSSEANDSQDESSQEITTEDEFSKKPDEERMLNDLTENQCNTISFTGTTDTITIPIESMKLDKAKEEDEKYIAYCTIQLKNECYEGRVTYCLNYEYYDIGGWQMNDCVEESRDIVSVAPDDKLIQEYIRYVCITEGWQEPEYLTLSEYEIVEQEKDYIWNCKYIKVDERKYADVTYEDTITCTFNQDTGWKYGMLNSCYMYDDWSKIIGKKFFTGVSDEGSYFNIEVLDFNTNSKFISLKLTGHTDSGWIFNVGFHNFESGWWETASKTIYDVDVNIYEELEVNCDYEEYYFVKEHDYIYRNTHSYDVVVDSRAEALEHRFSCEWDCDEGLTFFSTNYAEYFDDTIQEVN